MSFIRTALDHLDFELEFDAVLRHGIRFIFSSIPTPCDLPFEYLPEEAAVLAPFQARQIQDRRIFPRLGPVVAAADGRSACRNESWLHENIEYERREEGDPFAPRETLERQKGSCRDFAVLLAEVLRCHGLAAGWRADTYGKMVQSGLEHAENAFHAWVETYLPGAGWIGLDPTNGIFCDHHFLATAVGLTPREIAPIVGHYYGEKTIASTLHNRVNHREILK